MKLEPKLGTPNSFAGIFLGLALVGSQSGCRPSSVPSEGTRPMPAESASTAPASDLGELKTETNSIGLRLVFIPGGRFLMGHPKGAPPVHQVEVSDFWIGQYEVTNAQFERFEKRARPPESQTDQQPATNISWHDAVRFCQWLSRKEGRRYRLPTEAEWEYAARGGLVQQDYPWGNETAEGRAAVAMLQSKPVGSYPPNGFGLYDMAGNADEWVSDWYEEQYSARDPVKDPTGPKKPSVNLKVLRGGPYSAWEPYVWLRMASVPELRFPHNGFRVVREHRAKPASVKAPPAGSGSATGR